MTSDPCETKIVPGSVEGDEQQIAKLVDLFYRYVHADPLIGPIFAHHVQDWEPHLQAMRDFWSTALLGSPNYKKNAYAAHMRLPLESAHFDRWLALWEKSAQEALPTPLASRAIQRARHMTQSFRTGLLPWKRPDGSMSRNPH
jgi:hemoglobin